MYYRTEKLLHSIPSFPGSLGPGTARKSEMPIFENTTTFVLLIEVIYIILEILKLQWKHWFYSNIKKNLIMLVLHKWNLEI